METVKKLIKPKLDDEFAKTLGLEDLKTVKESIKLQLETEKRNEYDNKYYDELLDKLVKKSVVKYPPLALEDEINDVLSNFESNLAKQNLDLDTYLKINTREKEDFIEKDIKPAAQKRLEHALVMDEVSRTEKIELDQAELTTGIRTFLHANAIGARISKNCKSSSPPKNWPMSRSCRLLPV